MDADALMAAAAEAADAARLSIRRLFDQKYGAMGYLRFKCPTCGARREAVSCWMISDRCCGGEMVVATYSWERPITSR